MEKLRLNFLLIDANSLLLNLVLQLNFAQFFPDVSTIVDK